MQNGREAPGGALVNEGLLADAWEADQLVSGGLGAPTRPSVARWVSFLHRPSGQSWYRAHNASVVTGYLAQRDLAQAEHPLERFFMDVALLRVLFAECMLSDPRTALGRFAAVGRPLADPRWRGADVFLSLHNILPVQYPLDGLTIEEILDAENHLGRLLDYGVILPHVRAVYEHAATALNAPELLDMLRDGAPVYAWPYDARAVWTTTRTPRAIRTVRKLTTDLALAQP